MNQLYDDLLRAEEALKGDINKIDEWEERTPKRKWSEYRKNSHIITTVWLNIRKNKNEQSE